MKQKLLIITNLYPLPWQPNRATFNRQQFSYLDDEFDMTILVPVAWPDYLKHRKQIINTDSLRYVPYFYLPKIGRRFYSHFMFLSILLSSIRWIKSLNIDLIMACWAFPDAVAGEKLARLLNKPFFMKVHGSDINVVGNAPARAKQITQAANRSSGIVSVSQALADKMVSMGIQQNLIEVIYNGVNHDLFFYNNQPKKAQQLLFIGNIIKTKGVVELFDASVELIKKYPDLTLTFAGNGAMLPVLKEKVAALELQDQILLPGNINHDKLPSMVQTSSLVVLPSYAEGVPNVLLEAMASGTPVVATSVGGIPEIIDEGITGFLIETLTAKNVQKTIEKALNHDWDNEKISQSAKRFDWQKNKQALTKLLQSGIGS
jgi:glycosyltransferase involved in cell wall biosynthesis